MWYLAGAKPECNTFTLTWYDYILRICKYLNAYIWKKYIFLKINTLKELFIYYRMCLVFCYLCTFNEVCLPIVWMWYFYSFKNSFSQGFILLFNRIWYLIKSLRMSKEGKFRTISCYFKWYVFLQIKNCLLLGL